MKKIIAFILSAFTCMCLVACGNKQKYAIDDCVWVMASVQSVEQNGDFVAYAPSNDTFNKEAYPNAVPIDMACTAKDGAFSILDQTNHKTYNGTYKVTKNSSQTTIYEIVIEDESGTAVVSVTNNRNGTVIPAMILSVGNYVLNFQSK